METGMDKEYIRGLMGINTADNGRMVIKMGKESGYFRMCQRERELLRMAMRMELASILMLMALKKNKYGSMEKRSFLKKSNQGLNFLVFFETLFIKNKCFIL